MKYLKFFEAFVEEPKFYRFSDEDLSEGDYKRVSEREIRDPLWNDALIRAGFPDRKDCVHFMDSVAFDPSFKDLYGKNIYEIQVDNNSNLGWTFFVPINEWWYNQGAQLSRAIKQYPIIKERISKDFFDIDSYDRDESVADKMVKMVMDAGLIGVSKVSDLEKHEFFGKYPLFAWSNDTVNIKRYVEPNKETGKHKTTQLVTATDFEERGLSRNLIGQFRSSEWGKKVKELELSRGSKEDALKYLDEWTNGL